MHIYNLARQPRDERDLCCERLSSTLRLPERASVRELCPPVFDQGELGSCTANAGLSARIMLGKLTEKLSRLFLYYKTREIEGTVDSDSGATMRSLCKALQRYGACPEETWPYDISKFTEAPPRESDIQALRYRINAYRAVDTPTSSGDLEQIKANIARQKKPVLSGVAVYRSFESAETEKTGIVPMPKWYEPQLGGHAVLLVGYDDAARRLTFLNSWGEKWGDGGYGYLPYDYVVSQLAFDFWVLE